jgi:SAM-dependent methyltransferase
MSIELTGPNAEQIEFWNGDAGKSWAKNQAVMDSMIEPLGGIAIDESGVGAEDQVLDVGCGCGDTSLALARLGAGVTGIDVSEPMLSVARRRADSTGHEISFVLADALTHTFDEDYSLLYSRFGVMFFADPVAAFTNLAGALNKSGRLCFICWRPAMENEWISVPLAAALAHVPPPQQPAPRTPGEFAFSDKDYVAEILNGAGYKDIQIDPVDQDLTVGGASSIDQAMEFYEYIGPLARMFAELDEPTRIKTRQAVREAVQPYQSADGLKLGSACWLVKART